jgi:aconitase A
MSIFDASERYRADGTPLVILAGKEYGSGSSRDWAAKGPLLQGVRAVIAESFERIHRSNLVGMGILPLQFLPGESAASLGLTGRETFDILGISDGLRPHQELTVVARGDDGRETRFRVLSRLDGEIDVTYLRNGGVLQTVLRRLASTWREGAGAAGDPGRADRRGRRRLDAALPAGTLVGVARYGSAVVGGLRPDSDLDLFGVLYLGG